ncbi:small multidrug efflux protein [Georgenia faecalis]|uniref:small multidrug efflux protein n=1 Tax=Georgenia faecalis TaxID=2483799 RepID=UPI000FD93150|nr:small multidrug efflux protein [Georgenia faecalis]
MSRIQQLISNFQELVAQVPEIVQPLIILLAGAVPFVDGEGAAIIGIIGGVHPVVAAVAAAAGNFLCVLLVVAVTSRARTAVIDRRPTPVGASVGMGARAGVGAQALPGMAPAKPESKGRERFNRWLFRFGVPGASILGPLAIPSQITSAILIGGGTPRRWVLLWQAVSIALWTTVGAVSVWAALTYVVEVS